MKPFTTVALLAVLAGGCAQLQSMTSGLSAKVERETEKASQQARAEAEKAAAALQKASGAFVTALPAANERCAPLKNRTVSWEEEREIGGAVALSLAEQGKGYFIELSPELPRPQLTAEQRKALKDKFVSLPVGDKAKLTEYLNLVGQYLASASERPLIPWTFVVLDAPEANAFSAPGGYVFVTTGLLKLVDNEAQLAVALAHEIGHVQAKDSINAYMQSKYDACRIAVAGAQVLKEVPGFDLKNIDKVEVLPEGPRKVAALLSRTELEKAADELLSATDEKKKFNPSAQTSGVVLLLSDITSWIINHTGYAAENEYKADGVAHDLMSVSGYDTAEFAKLMGKLKDGGGFLSPHPGNKDRIARFNKRGEGSEAFAGVAAAPPNADKLKVIK